MDDFLALVRRRTSTRRYLDQSIPREHLMQCVEAARLAPSACNAQPWSFVVIDDQPTLQRLAKTVCHGMHAFNKFTGAAAAWIVLVSDREGFVRKAAQKVKGTDYYLIDIGIAAEHISLQAESLGLGSCMIGWFDENNLKRELDLPRRAKVDLFIALGYPATSPGKPRSRKSLQEIMRFHESGEGA